MIYIGIIGFGLIGKQVFEDIIKLDKFRVIGICNTKCIYLVRNIEKNIEIKNCIMLQCENLLYKFEDKLINLVDNINNKLVIIDCTASLDVARCYPRWLNHGINIVTPNKKGFSSEISLWNNIKDSSCLYESTVGAGLPIISTIKDMILSGDQIYRIEGIFSGTLSYIFNEFSKNNDKFSNIVNRAKELGYTEPDPRDDLNGIDVARKLVILARTIGLDITMDEVDICNIIPDELGKFVLSDFMKKLDEYDSIFEKYRGMKYVGIIDKRYEICEIKLIKYTDEHPFYNLTGSDNIIAIYSQRFNKQSLIIRGPGAGAEVTSFGILTDLLKIK